MKPDQRRLTRTADRTRRRRSPVVDAAAVPPDAVVAPPDAIVAPPDGVGVFSGAGNAPADSSAAPADLLPLGRVVGAYGLRGWIHVESRNRPEDSVLRHVKRWWLGPAPGARGAAVEPPRAVLIERVRTHAGALVAKPQHCADRDQAAALKGSEVLVSRADFPPGDEGEYYWSDLVGCEVRNPDGQRLGQVFGVEDHGAHPLLRLHRPQGGERMIPFIGVFILSVDLARRSITADWSPDD